MDSSVMEAKIVRQVSSTRYLLRSLVAMILSQKNVLTNWLLRTALIVPWNKVPCVLYILPRRGAVPVLPVFLAAIPVTSMPMHHLITESNIYDTFPFRLCRASVMCSAAYSWRSGKRMTIWTSMCRCSTTRCRTRTSAPSSAGLL